MTYGDVGGCKEQIEKLKEVVEMPLLHVSPKAFSLIGACSRLRPVVHRLGGNFLTFPPNSCFTP